MSNLRVAILVPPEDPEGPADQADTFVQAREISQCLTILGNESLTIIFGDDRDLVDRDLMTVRPDLVVNLIEDLPEGPEFAFRATEHLDRLDLPYTGASTTALRALADKREMKRRLRGAGLPVADDFESDGVEHLAKAPSPYPLSPGRGDDGTPIEPLVTSPLGGEVGPLGPGEGALQQPQTHDNAQSPRFIVKSAIEHASIGIDATSVVAGRAAVEALLAERRATRGGMWFAEAYIDGREFNVAILETAAGLRPLPVAEILFLDHADRPKILGYEEKWADGSAAYTATPRRFAATADDAPLHAELVRLSLAAWRLFGLRGYARVDFRVDEAGAPYILEVNANPCLSADAGFCAAAREAGLTQTDIVAHLIETALA